MHRIIIFLAAILTSLYGFCQSDEGQPPVVHPAIGITTTTTGGEMTITLIDKMQNFNDTLPYLDRYINSPKSVHIHPNGKKFYVNSLEGCCTVVYDLATGKRLKVINYNFDGNRDAALWNKPSGLFPFTHYTENLNTFGGKPVESTFSHGGRYLWVPFYRRTYDINAQDPSALAVIDTENDSIIRLMETGPLPKMIATSNDGHWIAVTQWGNNTVGLIDCSSNDPKEWHYVKKFVIDKELKLNLSLTESVDRDNESGYCLRGTVFTPDDRYLLIGCMSGYNGIAVIDMKQKKYLGRVVGMKRNLRHIVISHGWLYLSINAEGYVQRIKLDEFIKTATTKMKNHVAHQDGWQTCKVAPGTRTIEISPSGKYIFAACNIGSKLCVVDTRTMTLIGSIAVDSYPVGLDISNDGKIVIVTSQGRGKSLGGNAVNVYRIEYKDPEPVVAAVPPAMAPPETQKPSPLASVEKISPLYIIGGIVGIFVIVAIVIAVRRHRH